MAFWLSAFVPCLVTASGAGAVLTGASGTSVTTVFTAGAVLVNMVTVDVVQVTIVQVVDVVTVLHSFVTAVRAVYVRMILVDDVSAHHYSFKSWICDNPH